MTSIVRIAGRGDGVTEDGRHIPLAAPGDRVATDGAIMPGPLHVAPPCRHFPECGGCQLQHVDDASYARFLQGRITDALAAQGITGFAIDAPHLSPPRSRRRASLKAERRGKSVLIGFSEAKSHRIVDMQDCHILAPALFALVKPLRSLLAGMLPERRPIEIGMTLTDRGVDLALGRIAAEGLAASEALTMFAEAHALARLTIDDGFGPQSRWEPEPVTVTLGGMPVPLPPGAFLQATADGEARLVQAVRAIVGDARTIADLFAGLGTFALPLSADARVLAAEGARDAVLALQSAVSRAMRPVFVDHRDLFRRPFTGEELGRFDAVVLDPPRAGAREQVAALAGARVGTLAYVSCNPSTFARDARALVDGEWRLERILPVGQFRWSTHVELVADFRR